MDQFKKKFVNIVFEYLRYGREILGYEVVRKILDNMNKSIYVIIMKHKDNRLPIKFKICYVEELGTIGIPAGFFSKIENSRLYLTNGVNWTDILRHIPVASDISWDPTEPADAWLTVDMK